ncbi:MAG: zf-HC2 domain-containing protein [Acidobacteriota bacterium]|nr:zf-HC2 domain-containing protein [Acidobacteriota bacterium]
MNPDLHQRAQEMIAAALVEGLPASEQAWLDEHLQGCAACAQSAALTQRAIGALRSVAVSADRSLVELTQQRVRLRALELAERQERWLPLAVSCGFAALLSLVTLTYLWQGFAWMGEQWRLPALAWQAGFVSTWFLPTAVTAAALLWLRSPAFNGNTRTMHWSPAPHGRKRGK